MLQRRLTRRAILAVGGALGTGCLVGLHVRSVASAPLLTRRVLVVDWRSLTARSQTVSDRDAHGAPQGPQASRFLEDIEEEDGPLRIPVLGLGAFGAQVLMRLSSTRQTTALEWLSHAAGQWAVRARALVFVVADWGEEVSARSAAQLARQAQESGCLTVAIGPVPCSCPGRHWSEQARVEFALMCPWVDSLVMMAPATDHQTGSCCPGWHAARGPAHTWAAQVIDGMTDFLRPGMVCVDFADMRMLFAHSGTARAGCGWASGAHRTSTAIQRALTDPWLDAATLARAERVLITVTGSPDLTLYDIHETITQVQTLLSREACFVFGGLIEAQAPPETMQVMIVAGGLDADAGATSTGWT